LLETVLHGEPRPEAGDAGREVAPFTERRLNLTQFRRQPDGRWLIRRYIDTTAGTLNQEPAEATTSSGPSETTTPPGCSRVIAKAAAPSTASFGSIGTTTSSAAGTSNTPPSTGW